MFKRKAADVQPVMETIGNHADAEFIRIHILEVGYPPEGWVYLGSGWSRKAYLSPDGVVYKIGVAYCQQDELTNSQKYYFETRLRDLGFRIPRTTGYEVNGEIVVAMEYIEFAPNSPQFKCNWNDCDCGKVISDRCIRDLSIEFACITGISDLHSGNVYWKDDAWYIIDIAS